MRVANATPGTGALASIYAVDNTASPIAGSVVTTDSAGTFSFYAPDGRYDLTVLYSTTSKTVADIEISDITETNTGDSGANIVFANGLSSAPSIGFATEPTTGFYHPGAGDVRLVIASSDFMRWIPVASRVILASGNAYTWGSNGLLTPDTGLSRTAAGVISAGNGVTGDKTGVFNAAQYLAADGALANPSVGFISSPSTGMWWDAGNTRITFSNQGTSVLDLAPTISTFRNNAIGFGAPRDTSITRTGAGVLTVDTGTPGNALGVWNAAQYLAGDGSKTAPALGFTGSAGLGWYRFPATADIVFAASSLNSLLLAGGLVRQGSAGFLGWGTNSDPTLATSDTGLWRSAANTVSVSSSETPNSNGVIKAGSFVDNSANPAGTSGVLRIGNNISAVVGRNAANTGDVAMLTLFAGNQIGLGGFSTAQIIWLNGSVRIPNGSPLTWAGTTIGTADTSGLSQLGAASLAIGNGTNGDFSGSLKLTTLNYVTNLQHNGVALQSSDLSDVASLVTLTGTQTLTNKRVTQRVVTVTNATTLTPDGDNSDVSAQVNTQVAGTLTIAAPTGTPTDGQKLIIRVKSTNAQTYSFNATYAFSTTVTAPTTLAAGKTDYIGLMWNATNTKWDVVAVDQGH